MNNDTVIEVNNVSKKFSKDLFHLMKYGMSDIAKGLLGIDAHSETLRPKEFWALKDVSFTVKKGETLGIIGPNGSGKTTILKLLNGILAPDKGEIKIKGKVGALIEVGAGFHPLLTGRENIYVNGAILGMSKKEINKKFDSIVEFADIGDFLDSPVKTYSSGMFVRLGFAVATHAEPDILLVDEVLAVGDEGFQNKCFNKLGELRKNGLTTILVSHNMHAISTFCSQVLLMKNGKSRYFENVAEGVITYTNFFVNRKNKGIEKICSSNEKIKFFNVKINKRKLNSGDSFLVSIKYNSLIDYPDVEIDSIILSGNEPMAYFQAINKAYNKTISLKKGKHELKIRIENIQICNSLAKVVIAIYPKNRTGYLFWWRIPVEFSGVSYSTGKNFLQVAYDIE